MENTYTALMVILLFVAWMLPHSASANGGDGTIELEFRGKRLSAHIEDAPLPDVVAQIKEKQDIWVEGMNHLPSDEYSVDFDNMPLDEGLERILSTTNHCLVFDDDGGLQGIFILSGPCAPSAEQGKDTSYQSRSHRNRRDYHRGNSRINNPFRRR